MACWCLEVKLNSFICVLSLLRLKFPLHTSGYMFYFSSPHSAADNGTIHMWDWRTGYNFQRIHAAVQPGSLDSESGIFACMFDNSESRLITAEADKTIKVYKEDDTAVSYTIKLNSVSLLDPRRQKIILITVFYFLQTEESHPINWKPEILKRKRF